MFMDPEVWVAIAFLLFVALIVYLKVPGKVLEGLDARAGAIARELEEARKLRAEAEAVLADYKRRADNTEAEAAAILAQAEREAAAYAEEARAAFDETIARRLSIAGQKIKLEEEKARKQIRAQAAELAIAAAEQLIEQKLTGQVAENMITAGLDRIKKRLH
ncbi:MAG: ATP F0F1 synthase subunit B [Rhodomicrobium sp.]